MSMGYLGNLLGKKPHGLRNTPILDFLKSIPEYAARVRDKCTTSATQFRVEPLVTYCPAASRDA